MCFKPLLRGGEARNNGRNASTSNCCTVFLSFPVLFVVVRMHVRRWMREADARRAASWRASHERAVARHGVRHLYLCTVWCVAWRAAPVCPALSLGPVA